MTMKQYFTITISALLIAVFMLFNVGLPIVNYLCPMMSAENPTCAMMPSPGGQNAAITNIVPSCCAKYIVAERNTTPFLKIQEASAHLDAIALVPVAISPETLPAARLLLSVREESPPSPTPLFILHSSLLI
jgi:hypothetical protein